MNPNGPEAPVVYVVDDDPAVRDALTLLLEVEGVRVVPYESGEAFLAAWNGPPEVGCAIIDIRMEGMSGTQLHEELQRRGISLPVIFLTGHGDIPMSVRAIKSGAVDFLTKPVAAAVLRDSLRAALHESRRAQGVDRQVQDARERVDSLTLRERQVMLLAVQGQPNKEIARRLGISYRTVEIHRARVMQKTAAETLLELARLVQRSGLDGEPEA